MPVTPVRVEELPVGVITKTNWDLALAPLRESPGEWFQLRSFDYSAAANTTKRNLTMKLYKSFPLGEWEFQVRKLDDGKWHLYGRFLDEQT